MEEARRLAAEAEAKQAAGETFPLAHHVNTACNDKILGLPDDFAGTFMVEESYYEVDGKKSASPHLFLFTEEKDGVITLAKGSGLVFYLPVSKLQDPEIRRAIWDFVSGRVGLNG